MLYIKNLFFKYKLMRIRSKISYHAFLKNYTIPELILKQIVASEEAMSLNKEIETHQIDELMDNE